MSERYDEGTAIDVSFTIRLSTSATYDEIKAWMKFELGEVASISAHNPLRDDIEALPRSVRISPRSAPSPSPQEAEAPTTQKGGE